MASAAPSRRLRASCDFCTRRKRKCDGDGVNRCSFCVAKNQPECHYSVRRLTGPRPDSASRRASKALSGTAAKKAAAPSSGTRDDSGGGSGGRICERRYSSIFPLKRARLRPSPATGLVGLKENVYVAEFFRMSGILPFTSESFIRKAMVNTMFRAVQERDPGFHGCSAGFGGEGEEEEEGEEGGWGEDAVVPRAIESAAGACVLWCTVAMGCLIRGRPKSSVDEYARLAREALSDCFDDGSAQTAKAFTAMALLQDAMGNEKKFNKYIDFARSIMRTLPAEKVPPDLMESHIYVKACDLYDGFYDQLGDQDLKDAKAVLGLAKQSIPIQQAELSQWLVRTDIRLSACFLMDMQNAGSFGDLDEAGERSACSGPEPESAVGSGPEGDGSGDPVSSTPPFVEYNDIRGTRAGLDTPAPRVCRRRPHSDTLAEPPPPGPISQKFAAQILPDISMMMHATQRPEVRGGVGELKLLTIMAYASLLQGQVENAVRGLVRCTDILVEKPGICRSGSWKHLAHCCLAGMVVSGNADKYKKLRTAYNSVLDDSGLRAPPFEEYRGMSSICGNVMCKSVDNAFMAVAALKGGDGAPATFEEEEAKLRPSRVEREDVDMNPYPSTFADESWARGLLDKRRQPAGMQRGNGNNEPSSAAAPATAPAAVPAASPAEAGGTVGLVGAFGGGVEKEQHTATGVRFGFTAGAGPAGSNADSSFTSSISNLSSSSTGLVSATVAASAAAGQDDKRCLDQAGNEVIPMPLLPSVPSAQPSSADPGPAEEGDDGGSGSKGLELLRFSELKEAEAAGLLDAVDALLGEAVSEDLGEASGGEDRAPVC